MKNILGTVRYFFTPLMMMSFGIMYYRDMREAIASQRKVKGVKGASALWLRDYISLIIFGAMNISL